MLHLRGEKKLKIELKGKKKLEKSMCHNEALKMKP